MVYLVVISTYPNDKASEVGKMYLKVIQKYPDDPSIAEPTVLAAVKADKDGINGISMSKVKKGKLEAAQELAWNRMVMFNEIEDFRYTIDIWLEVTEALKLIGM